MKRTPLLFLTRTWRYEIRRLPLPGRCHVFPAPGEGCVLPAPGSCSVMPAPGQCRAMLLSLCLALLLLALPEQARAACPTGRIELFLPVPDNSQAAKLYGLLPAPWNAAFHSTLLPTPLPGLGGGYALNALQSRKGDGCFLAAVQAPTFFFLSETADSLYLEAELAPPTFIASIANALWVSRDSPLQSVTDLLRLERGNEQEPGRQPVLAGIGRYTDQHLATLQLNRLAGIDTRYLPLIGSAEACAAVLDGRADACWGYAMPPDSMPGLRPLAVAGAARSPALPATPTFREVHMDLINTVWFGLGLTSSATPRARQELPESLSLLLRDPDLLRNMLALGVTPLDPAASPGYLASLRRLAEDLMRDYPLFPPGVRRPAETLRVPNPERSPGGFHPSTGLGPILR